LQGIYSRNVRTSIIVRVQFNVLIFLGTRRIGDGTNQIQTIAFEQLDQLLGSGYPEKPATVLHRGIYTGDDDSGIQCYTLIGDLEPPRETLSKLARVGSVTAANAASNIASFLGVD